MDYLPGFLIVGASKSGTSSLYHYLNQHPEIFLSPVRKEGRYFSGMEGNYKGPGDGRIDPTLPKTLDDYKALFKGASPGMVTGDISPDYLYFYKNAVPRIKSVLGESTAILIILRSPAERAFSAYTHFKRDGREPLSFEAALEKEEERMKNNWLWAWQYRNSGLYYDQVKAYVDHFRKVKVILFEDFRDRPREVLSDICRFIGVDPDFRFDTSYKYNVSGTPRNPLMYKLETSRRLVRLIKRVVPRKLVRKMKKQWTGEKQMVKSGMLPGTRKQLNAFFEADIKKLEGLLRKDLSHWLK